MSEAHAAGRGGGAAVLSGRRLTKNYGPTAALNAVDIDLFAGEVLGVVGANGAGKSTLIKLFAGVETPTAGQILMNGEPIRLDGVAAAAATGIQTVHQLVDRALAPDLTVAENLVLDRLNAGELGAVVSRRRILAAARELVGEIPGISLTARVGDLRTSQRQQVLIARATATRPTVLILDEPTAALSVREQRVLFAQVRDLAAQGTAVVFISHHIGEIVQLCTRVVSLRNGRISGEFVPPIEAPQVVRAILGDQLAERPRAVAASSTGPHGAEVLTVTGVPVRRGSPGVDLTLHEGEVLGITGLLGAGKTELLRQIVGADPRHAGTVRLRGREVSFGHPAESVRAGVGFVPEDRDAEAEYSTWSVRRNTTIAGLRRLTRFGWLDRRAERRVAADVIDRLSIVAQGPEAELRTLSGGNRQKVVVGRWLAAGSDILVMDEPFRGVDIAARADIGKLLRSEEIGSAIVASSDPEEVLEVADRVLVMAEGRIVAELRAGDVSVDRLAELMSGSATRGAEQAAESSERVGTS